MPKKKTWLIGSAATVAIVGYSIWRFKVSRDLVKIGGGTISSGQAIGSSFSNPFSTAKGIIEKLRIKQVAIARAARNANERVA
jgi:hypothetical protein